MTTANGAERAVGAEVKRVLAGGRLCRAAALALVLAAGAVGMAAPAAAGRRPAPQSEAPGRPGDRVYVVIDSHDPALFSSAVKTGGDFLAGGKGRVFEIILSGRGILLAIPGSTVAQKDYIDTKRAHPDLRLLVCKETADVLQKANRRRVPYLPGARIAPCSGLRAAYAKQGFQRAMGF